ncbi:MAG: dTMP kinase [Candidatus Hydrothermarchaeales archaeon]
MFIALEGIDGSGKGAHSRLLNKWIKEKGYDTFLTREPTTGPIGKLLREFLKEGGLDPRTETLLFAADRSEHVKEIAAKLEAGKVVITERYFYSSIAYQGAEGLSIGWVKDINRFAPAPTMVLLLDVPPETGLERISSKNSLRGTMREKEYFEKKEFLVRVREIYLDLEKEYDIFARIDASKSLEEVQTSIRKKVSRILSDLEAEKKVPAQKGLGEYID